MRKEIQKLEKKYKNRKENKKYDGNSRNLKIKKEYLEIKQDFCEYGRKSVVVYTSRTWHG